MSSGAHKPHIVIIGGGFGGLEVAKTLAGKPVRVTLLDRQNHHLFQPLLYQVATAGLSPANIAQPLRAILRDAANIEIQMADVSAIDVAGRTVAAAPHAYSYDYLVLAAGARHSYFGHDEWEQLAPGLKSLDDATNIRRRILTAFEKAETATNAGEAREALTFVVVGGGPTGVEMAGAIAEMARFTLKNNFRHIDPASASVILVDAAPRVLPSFDPELSEKALHSLRRLGVEVRLNTSVKNISEGVVDIGGELIRTRTVVWAAGNAASPLGKSLGVPLDRAGRVIVNENLAIPGHPEVQVIGDAAHFQDKGGTPLPGVSPVAMQQGRQAAENILAMMRGSAVCPFEYFDKGSMATIGRHAAVADLHFAQFNGYLAWLAWLFIHLVFLVGLRNRISVIFQWMWAYFTFGRGARLITGVPIGAPGESAAQKK